MILEDLKTKLIQSQKNKDEVRLGVIRFLMSAIKNKEIELRVQKAEVTDEVILQVLKKQIKMRNDAIESYTKANRPELVEKETKEKLVLEELQTEYSPAN